MSTRTAKTATKKTAAKNPAKTTPTAPPRKPTTSKTSDRAADRAPKAELPTRPTTTDWMTDLQGYATLHALLADITTPHIHAWTDHRDGTATRPFADGTLTYQHTNHRLTWTAPCHHGAHHTYTLTAPGDHHAARRQLAWCTGPHTLTPPVHPLADKARALGDDLTKSNTATIATQPMAPNQIAAGLHARAHNEQPKEHPHP